MTLFVPSAHSPPPSAPAGDYAFGVNWKLTAEADGPIDIQSTAVEATPSRTATNGNGKECTFGFPTGMQGTINQTTGDVRLNGQAYQVNVERRFTMAIGAANAGNYQLHMGHGSPSTTATVDIYLLNRVDVAEPIGSFTHIIDSVPSSAGGQYVNALGVSKLEASWTAD